MLSDQFAILAAIRDRPRDDTPRLVYADERDDSGACDYAAFIRNHVQNFRDFATATPEQKSKLRSERAQLEAERIEDLGLNGILKQWHFERGFLTSAKLNVVGDYAAWACYLLATELLQNLSLEGPGCLHAVRDITRRPEARALRSLNIAPVIDTFDESGVEAIAESEYLTGLNQLSISNAALGDDSAALIAEAPGLEGLKRLSLQGNNIQAGGVEALAHATNMRLQELDLRGNHFGNPGVEALAHAGAAFRKLKKLLISNCYTGSGGIESLARADGFPALKEIWTDHEYSFLLAWGRAGDRSMPNLTSINGRPIRDIIATIHIVYNDVSSTVLHYRGEDINQLEDKWQRLHPPGTEDVTVEHAVAARRENAPANSRTAALRQ